VVPVPYVSTASVFPFHSPSPAKKVWSLVTQHTMVSSIIVVDFTSSRVPSIDELALKLVFMLILWACLLVFIKWACEIVARMFWSYPIPINSASIPSKFPHPNPPGSAVPFDIQLSQASEEQLEAFLKFRGYDTAQYRESVSLHQVVANAAAEYKGFLYEERAMKWIDDHFRLGIKTPYPYVGSHWNGWSSFWIETGGHIQNMFISSVVVIVEHCINGLILPVCYLLTHEDLYFNICLYSEVGYMIYATTLIILSYIYNKDVTIEQMHKSVWPLLLLHHALSMVLCIGCIYFIQTIPKRLVCWILLALLGFTSSLHYVGQILDFSPLSQANTPNVRMLAHILTLISQLWFRGLYWIKIVYMIVMHCIDAHGMHIGLTTLIIFLLFTAFNIDFIKFHFKATKGCWLKLGGKSSKLKVI